MPDKNIRKTDFFLTCFYMFFGLSVWFFPKSIDPVKFLGFSKPLVLQKPSLLKQKELKQKNLKLKQKTLKAKSQNLLKKRNPSSIKK